MKNLMRRCMAAIMLLMLVMSSMFVAGTAEAPTVVPVEMTAEPISQATEEPVQATVSSAGVVTAKGVGTATITIKTDNGKTDSINVTVR